MPLLKYDFMMEMTDSTNQNVSNGKNKPEKNEMSTNSEEKTNVKKNKRKPLYLWSTADVNKWLRKHCSCYCDMYENMFLDHEVTGRTLIRMNEIKLEKMGIKDANHRRELMQQILQQRLKHERTELKNADLRGTLMLTFHQNGSCNSDTDTSSGQQAQAKKPMSSLIAW